MFIAVAFSHVDPANWTPFAPFGWGGVMGGAALIFFAYIGFDAVSTAAEEAQHPQRDLPVGTLAAFFLVCRGVVSLRYTHRDLPRPFRTPWSPLVPLLGAGCCLYLMLSLPPVTWVRFGVWLLLGLLALVVGAEALVRGASKLALTLGVSPLVVGLTVVAFDTSSPELAVSVQSAYSGQVDIAIGNVIGSNPFNVLFILDLSPVVAPAALTVSPAVLSFNLPVMVACLPILFTGNRINRWEGLAFFSAYLAYTAYLVLAAGPRL